MITVEELQRLKNKVRKLQQEEDRIKGVLEEKYRQLRGKFECKTLEEADTLLEKKKRKHDKVEKELEEKQEKFDQEYEHVLE